MTLKTQTPKTLGLKPEVWDNLENTQKQPLLRNAYEAYLKKRNNNSKRTPKNPLNTYIGDTPVLQTLKLEDVVVLLKLVAEQNPKDFYPLIFARDKDYNTLINHIREKATKEQRTLAKKEKVLSPHHWELRLIKIAQKMQSKELAK